MRPDLDADGPAAPPRANGELVFDDPWHGRVFATTMAACDAGLIDYETFREHLISQVARRDAADDAAAAAYWEAWHDAFETLALEAGLVGATELDQRAAAFDSHA